MTDNAFYVSVEADDPKFSPEDVTNFLQSIGGTDVEVLEA